MKVILHDRFKTKLKQALTERGWTSSELSRRMGVSPQSVHQYTQGIRVPGLDLVEKFEAAIGAESGSLVDDQPLRLLTTVS